MTDTDHQSPTPTPFKASAGRRGRRVVRYVLAFVTTVLVIDAVVGDNGLLALLQARRDYQALEMALGHARAENASLREEARRLREDPSAIEDLARKDLGLIRPGEKLFIIRDVKPKSPK
ncbi:MAG: septum formation initiator family protein [Vicinamibacterales bacterium]